MTEYVCVHCLSISAQGEKCESCGQIGSLVEVYEGETSTQALKRFKARNTTTGLSFHIKNRNGEIIEYALPDLEFFHPRHNSLRGDGVNGGAF